MAKANLVLPDGTKVTIEGTPEEVERLLKKTFSGTGGATRSPSAKPKPQARRTAEPRGPIGHLRTLKEEGFFKTKRTIADVQKKLEEKGHIYAQTSLSAPLIRLTRSRIIGRMKEGGTWKYVHR